MADGNGNASALTRSADGVLRWQGKTWEELTEREQVEMPTHALLAFRQEIGIGEYRQPVESFRREAREDALTSNGATPDEAERIAADELRQRAAVGSTIHLAGARYPNEGADNDPEITGEAAYPEFVSQTHRFAWINGRPFVQKDDSGRFVNLNDGLPPATLFGFTLGPAPGETHRQNRAPNPTPIQPEPEPEIDWEHPPIATRSMARRRQQREEYGQLLELPETGGMARVKIMDALDRATLGWIPDHLQGKLAEMLDLVDNPKKIGEKVVSSREAWTRYQKMLGDSEELANAFCIHGFLDPRLVATEAELDPDDDHVMLVTDLTMSERRGYLDRCIRVNNQEARLFDPFRRQQVRAT